MIGASKFRSWLKHPGYNEPVTILAAIAGVGAVGSYVSSQEQASQQKKSIAAQQRIADTNAARERVQAAREARIKRAQIIASSGNQGIGIEGSGPAGALSSISSQAGSNMAYSNTVQNFAQQASAANQSAVDAGAQAANWQAIGGVAKSFIKPNMPSGWNNIFSTGNK